MTYTFSLSSEADAALRELSQDREQPAEDIILSAVLYRLQGTMDRTVEKKQARLLNEFNKAGDTETKAQIRDKTDDRIKSDVPQVRKKRAK